MTIHSRTASPPELEGAPDLCLSGQPLSIDDVHRIAARRQSIGIANDPDLRERLRRSEDLVTDAVNAGEKVYGITTGFGSMADVAVPSGEVAASQVNLLSFLSCSAGRPLPDVDVRAAMLLRANMLLKGTSGIRPELIERLVLFLNEGATPVVGELGSIGASGDLVPLAVIARAISGQAAPCRIRHGEIEVDGHDFLAALGCEPLILRPKEALAIVNGTSFSAAIAANCLHAAKGHFSLALGAHALMIVALLGHDDPFDSFVHAAKPHPGQRWVAEQMRYLLGERPGSDESERSHLQDRYSIRCLPQYLGPIAEGLVRITRTVETEMNAVTDNPLVDCEGERFLQSGNFLGQYVGMAMDDLRRYLALIAKHLDTQIALLVAPEFNHGLPGSLAGDPDSPVGITLKGLQIAGNSIVPQMTHLANPLVEHFPTHAEHFNQNINGLSWGSSILARQSIELSAHYAAISSLFAVQAIDLRARRSHGHHDGRVLLTQALLPFYESVYAIAGRIPGESTPLVDDSCDRPLETIQRDLASSIDENDAMVGSLSFLADRLTEAAPGD